MLFWLGIEYAMQNVLLLYARMLELFVHISQDAYCTVMFEVSL